MQKLDLKSHYNVIIIGSGVSGLTAAALLSRSGLSVCVLEKAANAGGYLAGFRRKHFRFDTAIHWLNQFLPDGMVSRVFDIIGRDHPTAIVQKNIKRYSADTHDYLLTNTPDDLKKQWIEDFPEDKKGIDNFFADAKKIGRSFNEFNSIMRSEELMDFPERMHNKIGLLRFALPFIKHIRYHGEEGVVKGLKRYFSNPKLISVFSCENDILSCLVPIGWAYYSDYQRPPVGGGQVIPEWLCYVTQYYKNEIYFKCRVEEILLENNTCKGVRFAHRGSYHDIFSDYVLAACDVETLYEKMLPAHCIPQKLKDKLRNAEIYSSSVTVNIAINCLPSDIGFGDEMLHITQDNNLRSDHNSGDPLKSGISVLAPSLADPSLAPAGQGTITLFMPAFMHYNNNWNTGQDADGNYVRNDAYKELKEHIASIMIDRVCEKVSPRLKEHILFYDVATPVTHWRYTGNKNGTMMGAKPGRKNMQSKIAHYQTPVKNLILSGHWAELGGGVPIAVKAGCNASLFVLRKEKKELYKSLSKYLDGKQSLQALEQTNLLEPYPNDWVREATPAEKYNARVAQDLLKEH